MPMSTAFTRGSAKGPLFKGLSWAVEKKSTGSTYSCVGLHIRGRIRLL